MITRTEEFLTMYCGSGVVGKKLPLNIQKTKKKPFKQTKDKVENLQTGMVWRFFIERNPTGVLTRFFFFAKKAVAGHTP